MEEIDVRRRSDSSSDPSYPSEYGPVLDYDHGSASLFSTPYPRSAKHDTSVSES